MVRYVTLFVLILCTTGISSCKDILASVSVHVTLPDITYATSWKENDWVLYYPHTDGTIHSKTVHNSRSTSVTIRKIGAIPIVGCIDIPLDRDIACAFQVGAVYPYDYDATKRSMALLPYATAETANVLLNFYTRGVNLDVFNAHKLYTTIVLYAQKTPIHAERLLHDLANNTISTRSIDRKKSMTIPLPVITYHWINTLWGQDDIYPHQKKIHVFYPGRWLFVRHNSSGIYNTFAWISVDSDGTHNLYHFE